MPRYAEPTVQAGTPMAVQSEGAPSAALMGVLAERCWFWRGCAFILVINIPAGGSRIFSMREGGM